MCTTPPYFCHRKRENSQFIIHNREATTQHSTFKIQNSTIMTHSSTVENISFSEMMRQYYCRMTEKNVTREINMAKAAQLDKLAAFRQKLYKEPVLRLLFLELTLRCNEHCFHCGSRCSSDSMDGMPLEKYLEVLRDIKENLPGRPPITSIPISKTPSTVLPRITRSS